MLRVQCILLHFMNKALLKIYDNQFSLALKNRDSEIRGEDHTTGTV